MNNNYKTMDANQAVSSIAYKFSEVCGIYPITPASPMAENIDTMASTGEENYFGNKVKVIEMESEAGAIALVHGILQSGILASTFTASQGLLLMIPSLYKLAGEMLPGVIHVAARSLSTHALSIFGDHQDVYAASETGVCMLASSNPEQAYYMAALAHLVSIKSSLPFINFFDGFRTSHEINKIKIMDLDKIKALIDESALNKFRNKAMNDKNPNTRGTAQNEDIYFQNTEARNNDYNNVINITEDYMNKLNKITNMDLKPFNYYGSKKAKYIIVAMGSVNNTIREVINELNKKKNIYGLIEVHLFRPFNNNLLKKVIPTTVETISVLDRAKDFTTDGEKLYLDVVNALNNTKIKVLGGRYGLSSKNTNPQMIKAVFDNMKKNHMKNHFTIGINDDVTNLSLDIDDNFKLNLNQEEFLIYGYGSDGMVSTSKDLIKIIGDNTNKYVQGYFQYDSKKSGGVTRSHIRISNNKIYSSYYVENPKLVVVSKDNYMYKYDLLDNIKENGVLLLNTNLTEEQLKTSLPNKVKYQLAKKNISLYTIDAYKLVNELGLKNKISTCMEICIFSLLNIFNLEKVKSIMKETNQKRFLRKGQNIVDINNKVVDESLGKLSKIEIDNNWLNLKITESKETDFNKIIGNLKGDTLPVSAFLDKKDGIFKGASTKNEKRAIAEFIPCWQKENCIECNQCTFVCPHGVIRPFLTDKLDNNIDSIPSIMPKDYNYTIGISYEDCTGCGLCANTCPGKLGNKALKMVPYDRKQYKEDEFMYLLKNNKNKEYKYPLMNVKNIGFTMPNFEFSGSCSGCGETAYLKNLTQVFNNNLYIANATGCSSIYSSSIPSTPYNIPWASSLFEDNSEFGLGILTGINLKREKIEKYMQENLNKDKSLFTTWIENKDDYDKCLEIEKTIDYKKHKNLLPLKDYITPKSIWIVGGDGFAYDIGYGGLDHILSRNDNINILILDTEVYSNTGGQSSKSSNLGSIASFTANGKQNYKKDLAKIAMCYPHVYVACVNIGYNKEQYLKALEEANNHKGPSIIIAYCPCIEHGIKQGMEHSLDNAKLAGECGYFLNLRFNPNTQKLTLDSKNIDFSKYHDYLMTENRYANLNRVNKEKANIILEDQRKWAIKRYEYYKKIAD